LSIFSAIDWVFYKIWRGVTWPVRALWGKVRGGKEVSPRS